MAKKEIPEGLMARAEGVVTRVAEGDPGGKMYIRRPHNEFGRNIDGDPARWCHIIQERIEGIYGVRLSVRNGRDGGTLMRNTDKRLNYIDDPSRSKLWEEASSDKTAHTIPDIIFRRIAFRALSAARTNKPFSLRANDYWSIESEDESENVVPLHGEIMTLDLNGNRISIRRQLEVLFEREGLKVLFGQATHQRFATPATDTQFQTA